MSHHHLTYKHRAQIELGIKQNMSNVTIAKIIGCHEYNHWSRARHTIRSMVFVMQTWRIKMQLRFEAIV